jgi:O-antigen/teichoic acid export membrane protein
LHNEKQSEHQAEPNRGYYFVMELADEQAAIDIVEEPAIEVSHKTAISGTWTVGARLVSRVIDLGTMLVLAHLLTPKDFGLVAIAMTIIYIMEAAFELPVSQALVRLDKTEPSHYDTAFTLSLLRGLALSLIVCLSSWPFARFYADSRLLPLVCALSLAPAARGLVSPRLADFSRNLDFSPDFTMEFFGKLAAFATAILLAITVRSYWAIAAGTIVAPITATCISYVLAPYRPHISLSKLPAFSGFLGWITAAQVVGAFNWQTDRLLLGKLMSKSSLGLFTTANDTSSIPVLALFSPILRPLLSAFSLLKKDPKRLGKSYQNSAIAMVTLGLPILVAESLLAYPAVRLMLGEKWMGAAPLLRLLALSLIPSLFAMPLAPLVMTFGRTHIFLQRNLFEVCIKLPLVVLGARKYGFMGVVIARCISESATVFFCMIAARKLVGLSVLEQLRGPWRSIVSAIAMALVVWLSAPKLTKVTGTGSLALHSLVALTLGIATYCGVLWASWVATGRPSGIESILAARLPGLLTLRGRQVAPQAL